MYFDLPEPLLPPETLELLTKWASDRADSFLTYKGQGSGLPDGNNFLISGVRTIPGVQALVDTFTLPAWPLLLMQRPRVEVRRHSDDPNRRNTVIIQPLFPQGADYSGTYFWETLYSEEPIGFADFTDGNPKIVDTQRVHSLVNESDLPRYNFQICFYEPFEKVKQLWIEGKLLK